MPVRRDPRPFSLAVLIGCLLALHAVVLIQRDQGPAAAADDPRPTASSTPSTIAPVPTTTVPAQAPQGAGGPTPKAAPSQPHAYDNEAVVQIGTISIPKIGLVSPVFEGNTLTQIDHGPSHWPGTALPGQVGNAVFAGHRVTHTHPFLHIDQLVPGDLVYFDIGGAHTTYRVTGHDVVTPKEVWIINQTPTPTATLFGCHPPHSARYRYVVHLALAGN